MNVISEIQDNNVLSDRLSSYKLSSYSNILVILKQTKQMRVAQKRFSTKVGGERGKP